MPNTPKEWKIIEESQYKEISSINATLINLSSNLNAGNALRLAQAMRNNRAGTTLRLRSEEDATQENYFCRIRAEQYNFSANHTFVSGSKNKIRNF